MSKVRVIYDTDYEYNTEDVKADLADLRNCPVEDISEDDVYNRINFYRQNDFDDTYDNLYKVIDNRILVIADLGLWRGRVSGYKELGNNLNNLLSVQQGDYYKLYCDRYDVRADDTHHDGTNHYLFREIKPDVDIDVLESKIYDGEFTRKDITKYTKSLKPYISKVFGW